MEYYIWRWNTTATIYQKDKKTGITYVYSQTSEWIPELGQPRSHRKLIGKLSDTGEIIPTGRVGRPKKNADSTTRSSSTDQKTDTKEMQKLKDTISRLEARIAQLEAEQNSLKERISKARMILSEWFIHKKEMNLYVEIHKPYPGRIQAVLHEA